MTTAKMTLKGMFSNGKIPPEQHFWAWLDSYWHKDEKIPIDVIDDINNILINKADKDLVNKLIQELERKADKVVVDTLQEYVNGLIDDTLTTAHDKTYSINRIYEITSNFLTEAVTDLNYDTDTGTLTVVYENEQPKSINLGKINPINIINDDLEEGKQNTYSIDKINSLIGNPTGNLIVENNTNEALSYEQLESLYPDFKAGDILLCINAGYKYEKTQRGWIEYIVRKLEPKKPEFKGTLLFSNITSPTLDEISRESKIVITEIDKPNSRFKCDISDIYLIKMQGVNGQPWFIAQGNEASSFCEIVDVDNDGWIYYSTVSVGNMNMNLGESVEFFNPFTNYEILNNECPTLATERSNNNNFQGYPESLNGKSFKYLIHGGILKKKSDNNYRAYMCAVGSGDTFIAEDSDINGSFKLISQTPFFEDIEYPDGRIKGSETLMWGITPVDKGFFREYPETCYIGLLGVKDGGISNAYKANYPGFILLNNDGDVVNGEKIREAKLINTYLSAKSSWDGGWHITGLSFFKDNWHLVVKNWNQVKMAREVWHIIICGEYQHNLIDILEGDDLNAIKKAYLLHKGNDYISCPNSIFYGQSDFNLFTYKNQLYCFYFLEPKKTGYVNSMNRMCGIAKWDDKSETWNYQNGLQLINPVQLFRKYPHLFWCYDHWGNLCCPFIENNNIYIATYIGTDNPDYFPAILKLNLNT